MKILQFELLILLFLFAIAACVDDETPPPPPDPDPTINLEFKGVQMTDANGQPIGCYGDDCMDDWTNISLTSDERSYLSFNDSISPFNLDIATAEMFPIYPNPIGNTGSMGMIFETTGKLKFKIVVIDTMAQVLIEQAFETQNGFNNLQLSPELFKDFERKTIYRMYYGFYDATNAPVYRGYGDFGICEEDFNPNPQDCFE